MALQGDASDNVPGVADVGPKTAMEWIQKYGSVDNLLSHADEIAGKRGDNLRKSKDVIHLSRRLVTIDCDVPVKIDYEAFAVKPFDEALLTQIFNELGFTRMLRANGAFLVRTAGSNTTAANSTGRGACFGGDGQTRLSAHRHAGKIRGLFGGA